MQAWLNRLRGLPALVTPQIELPMSAGATSLDVVIVLRWCIVSGLRSE